MHRRRFIALGLKPEQGEILDVFYHSPQELRLLNVYDPKSIPEWEELFGRAPTPAELEIAERNREMTAFLRLSWLPEDFPERVLTAFCPPSQDYAGYLARARRLKEMFGEVLDKLTVEGVYGEEAIGEAFRRRVIEAE